MVEGVRCSFIEDSINNLFCTLSLGEGEGHGAHSVIASVRVYSARVDELWHEMEESVSGRESAAQALARRAFIVLKANLEWMERVGAASLQERVLDLGVGSRNGALHPLVKLHGAACAIQSYWRNRVIRREFRVLRASVNRANELLMRDLARRNHADYSRAFLVNAQLLSLDNVMEAYRRRGDSEAVEGLGEIFGFAEQYENCAQSVDDLEHLERMRRAEELEQARFEPVIEEVREEDEEEPIATGSSPLRVPVETSPGNAPSGAKLPPNPLGDCSGPGDAKFSTGLIGNITAKESPERLESSVASSRSSEKRITLAALKGGALDEQVVVMRENRVVSGQPVLVQACVDPIADEIEFSAQSEVVGQARLTVAEAGTKSKSKK